jgi:hypothetical protein
MIVARTVQSEKLNALNNCAEGRCGGVNLLDCLPLLAIPGKVNAVPG